MTKRAMQLRIRMSVDDGVVGHPTRLTLAFNRVRMALERGERGGTFLLSVPKLADQDVLDVVTVDFDVFPTDPYVPATERTT